ncbi:MAG TPA: hypothetical protein VJV23_05615, partial [Candidatus Polarisedimenticolia bacterium]|nr:hypothetical protein [Candidatus Polarisedimenticolia bacterium]
ASLVFARSSEGGTAAAGLGEIMAAVCRARGGKGGGGGTFARGGGIPAAAAAEALEEAFGRLRSGAASGAPGAHDPP